MASGSLFGRVVITGGSGFVGFARDALGQRWRFGRDLFAQAAKHSLCENRLNGAEVNLLRFECSLAVSGSVASVRSSRGNPPGIW